MLNSTPQRREIPPASCNIVRPHWPIELEKTINLYLGNGRCGGCFDALGPQHQSHENPTT